MNRILVLPQRLARTLDLEVQHATISIRDPHDEFAMPPRWGRRGVLPLYFHDLEKFGSPEEVALLKGMAPNHADAAWSFIREHADEIDTLVIHCWAGKSRSVGMAQAVAQCVGPLRVEIHTKEPTPNTHVHRLMMEGWKRFQPPTPRLETEVGFGGDAGSAEVRSDGR